MCGCVYTLLQLPFPSLVLDKGHSKARRRIKGVELHKSTAMHRTSASFSTHMIAILNFCVTDTLQIFEQTTVSDHREHGC
jgi:hypothetical protein